MTDFETRRATAGNGLTTAGDGLTTAGDGLKSVPKANPL